jgi:RHS repeat-associated protein
LVTTSVVSTSTTVQTSRVLGVKHFEIGNHLGNVINVVTDRKIAVQDATDPTKVAYFEAEIIMQADYYPFGMEMSGRTDAANSNKYEFGYNGMRKDNDVSGEGNAYTTEFRQYDPRLGRWTSLDPLMGQFPWMSPFVAFDNNPVYYTDPYGLAPDGEDGEDGRNGEYSGPTSDRAQIKKKIIATDPDHKPGVGNDMKYGDFSRDRMMTEATDQGRDQISAANRNITRALLDESNDDLFDRLYSLAETFADGDDAEIMTKGLVDHFKENSGLPYKGDRLTEAANNHPTTRDFIEDVRRKFIEEVSENGFSANTRIDLAGHPVFNIKGFMSSGDEDNGLLFSVNDVWSYKVEVISYKQISGQFEAEIKITLYDHFGLDTPDMEKIYKNMYPEFSAWFILQHVRGFKPFITVMPIKPFKVKGVLKK